MSLLLAGIFLLLFIWIFAEVSDRLPRDRGKKAKMERRQKWSVQ